LIACIKQTADLGNKDRCIQQYRLYLFLRLIPWILLKTFISANVSHQDNSVMHDFIILHETLQQAADSIKKSPFLYPDFW